MILINSCKKDSLNYQSNNCVELPQPPLTGWNMVMDIPFVTFPYFNPNKADEIIFQQNISDSLYGLYKYNLITKQKKLIFSGKNLFQPKWGRNDWILLNHRHANIWKINSNGDSLCQLTFHNCDFGIEWNSLSPKFFSYRSSGSFQRNIIFNNDSSQTGKMIYQPLDRKVLDPGTLKLKSRLFIMNTDGSNEEEIYPD